MIALYVLIGLLVAAVLVSTITLHKRMSRMEDEVLSCVHEAVRRRNNLSRRYFSALVATEALGVDLGELLSEAQKIRGEQDT
ncbi:hypothetical protein SAMN05216266_1105 [Amycolatopsis marina]|uniref:Uncharacterized protein n=1 Tax=Amycolatopsis marina TaxID=490629 RepID=A0A1I1ANN7_9PSEU|nr:hypothetical protein [Amycolatopsis marina]SFB39641.1 hypothetical protein SAMN05216266_1105 [Amycolatopsis marina]